VPIFRAAQGSAQLQVVPIDYAVEAGMYLAEAPESIGHTYHVVDRAALSLDEALSLIADLLGKPQPRGGLPPALAQALLRIPGVDRLAHAQRALVDELGSGIRYDDSNAAVLLDRGGLRCPSFASYVGKLVAHVERERRVDRPLPSYSLLR
jgi:nucleoside-diphosphate-sugar epimerase